MRRLSFFLATGHTGLSPREKSRRRSSGTEAVLDFLSGVKNAFNQHGRTPAAIAGPAFAGPPPTRGSAPAPAPAPAPPGPIAAAPAPAALGEASTIRRVRMMDDVEDHTRAAPGPKSTVAGVPIRYSRTGKSAPKPKHDNTRKVRLTTSDHLPKYVDDEDSWVARS